jgi:SWI/SNF-related matrix-associated actin-dependent regulator of chromatin subfamily A member 5
MFYEYRCIDGGTAYDDRINAICGDNKPGNERFIFLLTTRAGGVGINPTTAAIVVPYNSDWYVPRNSPINSDDLIVS